MILQLMIPAVRNRIRASDALRQVGLRELTHKLYIRKMEKLGISASRFLNAVDAGIDPARMQAVYDLQHVNTRVSKLVTSFSYYRYYSTLFDWIQKNLDEPNNFLDLGCGNGQFTMAISYLFSRASGLGIDKNTEAIRAAIDLKSTYAGGDRIDFLHIDFSQNLSAENKALIGMPEIVFSSFLLHELMHDEQALMRTLANFASILPGFGKLVSLDRFPDTERQRSKIIDLMHHVGLKAKRKEVLHIGDERFPLTVFTPTAGSPIESTG